MKPLHELEHLEDLEMLSFSPVSTAANFTLGAWGDRNNKTEECARVRRGGEKNDEEDEDDEEDDCLRSCEWSLDVDDVVDDDVMLWDEEMEDEDRRRVHFASETEVRTFERCTPEESCRMHYTAHELQKMMDHFIKRGGTKLLGSPLDMPQDDDDSEVEQDDTFI
eukprot:CAMPEP_0116846786 /NCGR_PEP_ID=MMETSP0418-20121206/14042_1 /TAXON_ID=1158023 /ORGANISM="Astrosyne radiata, Strain 13vi08-1A" /LENGTH=164 /DNA_ID=CAMNT_0004478099 /DNA_START=164 /DNA_END=658 /DNA_ORIENTATION=-